MKIYLFDANIDWQKIAPELAKELLGEPKTTTSTEYRWGNKGSLVLNLNDATWYDFENDTGGGIVDLIKHLNQDVKVILKQYGYDLAPQRNYSSTNGTTPLFLKVVLNLFLGNKWLTFIDKQLSRSNMLITS